MSSRRFLGPVSVLLTLALVLAGAPASASVSKALLYNCTGEDLKIVIDGRSNILSWKSPAHVYSGNGAETIRLEMANLDGELLKAELEDGSAYVILFRVSQGIFAVWRIDDLESNLDQILDEHPASAKAAVFNSTGQPLKFKFGPWERGIGREMCVFIPNAARAKDLKFDIVYPDLGSHGPVAQSSLHVVAFEEGQGYSFLPFKSWVSMLETRLNGGAPPEEAEPDSAVVKEETLPVLTEDLKDG